MTDKEQTKDIELNEFLKETPEKRFKSYTVIIILTMIFVLFIFMLGKFGGDFFSVFIFLLIFSIPVIIVFDKQIKRALPTSISNLILADVEEKEEIKLEFSISQFMKEVAVYVAIGIFLIGGMFLLYKVHKDLKRKLPFKKAFTELGSLKPEFKKRDKTVFIQIIGAVVCFCISGVSLLKLDPQ